MSGINYQHMAGSLLLYYALLKFLFLTVSLELFQPRFTNYTKMLGGDFFLGGVLQWRSEVSPEILFSIHKKGMFLQPEMRKKTLVRGISFQSCSEAMHRNSFLMFMYKIGCCTRKRLIPPSHARWQVGARMAEDFGIRADLGEIWWEAKPGSTQSGRAARGFSVLRSLASV